MKGKEVETVSNSWSFAIEENAEIGTIISWRGMDSKVFFLITDITVYLYADGND